MQLYELEFLKQQGDKIWLHGVENIPAKLRALCEINKILAHQPWLISARQIEVDDLYMLQVKMTTSTYTLYLNDSH